MISRLKGVVELIKPPLLVIDVGGVGYEVSVPIRDFEKITLGDSIGLSTHLVIREDSHSLFGFIDVADRDMFRELIKVNGIGPKVGLALVSTYNCDEICKLIDSSSVVLLSKAPGVGKKTAERLILELGGKLKLGTRSNDLLDTTSKLVQINQDLIDALLSLGYTTKQIDVVIKELPKDIDNINVALKQALQILSK